MVKLYLSDAIALVRKNLDEVEPNGSVMYEDEGIDNLSLDDIIAKHLPEAINAVHLSAPVQLLEGKPYESSDLVSVSITDGILSVALKTDTNYLRLVTFQAADSYIVVTDVLGEASPEGRKQLNPYLRGRADRPRLVLMQGRHSGPVLKYYTLTDGSAYEDNPESAISRLTFVQEQFYIADNPNGYDISRRLRQNIIDYLTAMVLETYGNQHAESYYQKANSYSTI